MTIFATEAPKYWNAGLPAIPLMFHEKRPAIQRWQLFADTFPTQEERDVWLSTFPDGNIGLPMGPSSGFVAVDIDTDDARVLALLDNILPDTPWKRRGKKGMVRIYRYNNERTTRIKTIDNEMVCEILSKGTQIVLPPSIHPDTQRPYTANSDLWAVKGAVPTLPLHVEDLIRGALKDLGIDVSIGGGSHNKTLTFVPAGARDNTMVWQAGLLARAVVRGERTLLQALGEMEAWVGAYVEQVIGDELTVEKAQKKVVEFLVRDVTGERRVSLPVGWDEGISAEDKAKMGLELSQDHEKWAAAKILEHLVAEFERTPDANSEGRLLAVNTALDAVARSEGSLSVLDEERILRFIAGQSQGTMTIAGLKSQVKQLRRGDIAGENHQEIADAVIRQVSRYGELRHHAGRFWQWRGAFWERTEESSLLKVIQEDFGFYPMCKKNSDYRGVLRVMEANVTMDLAQVNIRGLNFANGFLTEDMRLIEHNPDHGMTYVLPYRYLPELSGKMPLFAQYIADSWDGDPDYADKIMALQEIMGATLFSHGPTYQRACLLYGAPGSGKSVLTAIVRGLLPNGSVSTISPSDWSDKFLPAEMFGKVLNLAGELSESRPIPGDIFKQVVVGEPISAQYKNQTPFSFKPTCAQWFSSNFLPRSRDGSSGFNRRWLILEWNHKVDEHKKIVDLDQIILENEREAIVAWAAEGFVRLKQNRGYTLPASHMASVDQMAYDNNSVRYFLAVCPKVIVGLEKTKGLSVTEITAAMLHEEYWSFCIGTGIVQRVSLQKFQGMMRELKDDFSYEVKVGSNSSRSPETVYRYITLADARKG